MGLSAISRERALAVSGHRPFGVDGPAGRLVSTHDHVVDVPGVGGELLSPALEQLVDHDAVPGPGSVPALVWAVQGCRLRGAGSREGESAGPGPGNREVGHDRACGAQELRHDDGIRALLSGGAEHAGEHLLGGGPAPGEIATPGLPVDHGGTDGPLDVVVGGRTPGSVRKLKSAPASRRRCLTRRASAGSSGVRSMSASRRRARLASSST